MVTLEALKEKKEAIEEALNHCKVALAHEDYSKPFEFKRMDRMSESMVNHPLLKGIVGKCVERKIGFDPNLCLQHIEREALDQFNAIALEKIKGAGIPSLMEMRHELELFMLKDRHDHYVRELGKAEKALLEAVTGVGVDTKEAQAIANIEAQALAVKKKKK